MDIKLNIKLSTFCITQFSIVTLLVLAGLAAYIYAHITGHEYVLGFLPLFDVGNEQSFPTYFSVLNLLLASILFFVLYLFEKTNHHKGFNYWLYLAVLFLLLSCDESVGVHENFSNIHDYLAAKDIIPALISSHTWLPFGVLFVFVVGVSLVPFLRSLSKQSAFYFVLSGGIFLTGAIGFEYLGAVMLEHGLVDSKADLLYKLRRVFEEAFEMYGIAILNCALYREMLNRKLCLAIHRSES
ncbi:hypothetical protein ACFL6Z_08050 [Pseudomonadota bacterium]|uniref:hypothetical protein n=1 Tax=unclassified Shewanella TaxID=196818 RepID=UPI0026E35D74|nr:MULTISPECIES: hypothetical protein [unclassified Shewanella]MDO6617977.1 hypothetical protein [Shewanella sp. 6_MG-2023]MDO6678246.1 hypothetical protein [Shewanella sp. 4_MG-2023]MDO6777299.1 hypothetical protein [Shewanella sp. 3_MG-2023]